MSSDDMQRKLVQLSDANKKIADYEGRIAMFSQEIERLNNVVEKKNAEVSSLTRKMS